MVKIVYSENFAQPAPLYASFANDTTSLLLAWRSQALLHDSEGDDYVALHGRNLEYSSDAATGGTITRIAFKNAAGDDLAVIKGIALSATDLSAAWNSEGGVESLVREIFDGNDRITGSNAGEGLYGYAGRDRLEGRSGADLLEGGRDNDVLTGGRGSDEFSFRDGDGRDRITDFDPVGGEGKQDFITLASATGIQIERDGKDMLVHYGPGADDVIRVENVSPSQFGDDDVMIL